MVGGPVCEPDADLDAGWIDIVRRASCMLVLEPYLGPTKAQGSIRLFADLVNLEPLGGRSVEFVAGQIATFK